MTSTAPPCPCEPATPGALPVNTSSASVRAAAWLAIAPPFGSSPPVSVSPLTVTLLAPELIARIPVVPPECATVVAADPAVPTICIDCVTLIGFTFTV